MDYLLAVGFGAIFLCTGIVGVVQFISYQLYLKQEKEKSVAWQPLTKINPHLEYIKTTFFNEEVGHIAGNFRNHPIKLDTITARRENKPTHIYTRLLIPIIKEKNTITKQMTVDEVNILFATSKKLPQGLKGKVYVQKNEQKIEYEQHGIEGDVNYLQFLLNYLSDLAEVYPTLVASGGTSVSYLQKVATDKEHQLQYLAFHLLQDIACDTTSRLSDKLSKLICPYCYKRVIAHQIPLLWRKVITYYGCRNCHQSSRFFQGKIIAVLDDKMATETQQVSDSLNVNWLSYGKPFDFEEIKIIQAIDEDVERFVIQIGNNTDTLWKSYYQQMPCVVSARCELSENTMRILQHTFGQIKIKAFT